MPCLCPNAAFPLRFQWQAEQIWYLVHCCTNPINPCNGSHVPWKQRLNAHCGWAFVVTNAVMNNLRNSAFLYKLPPSPQDVLDQTNMIPTKGRSIFTRTVTNTGNETLKEAQLVKNTLTPSKKSSSLKSIWLRQINTRDHLGTTFHISRNCCTCL